MSPETFGTRLRRLREERQITLRGFARQIDVSATYLSKVERGETPPPAEDRIRAIAEILEQDPDELLAQAGKVAAELMDIIQTRPREMATFLRTAQSLSPKDLKHLQTQAENKREEESAKVSESQN